MSSSNFKLSQTLLIYKDVVSSSTFLLPVSVIFKLARYLNHSQMICFTEWSERAKQIAKLWKKVPTEERAPFLVSQHSKITIVKQSMNQLVANQRIVNAVVL